MAAFPQSTAPAISAKSSLGFCFANCPDYFEFLLEKYFFNNNQKKNKREEDNFHILKCIINLQ
jgi:hypothetical protein